MSATKSIAIESLPEPGFNPAILEHRVENISSYLETVFYENRMPCREQMNFPSLLDLSGFFQCSHLEMYDSLQQLRRCGFDYELTGLERPIVFWCTGRHKTRSC